MTKNTLDALQLYLFDTQGYLHMPDVLSAQEVDGLKASLDDLEISATPFQNTKRWSNIERTSNVAAGLLDSPRLLGAVSDVINQPVRLIEAYATRREARSDLLLHNGLSENVNLNGELLGRRNMAIHHTYHDERLYCQFVKTVIYLDGITADEDGPFCYIEGSHKANYPLLPTLGDAGYWVNEEPLAESGFPSLRKVYAKAGDVILLNEALMHGTLPKLSGGPRTLVAFGYGPSHMTSYKEYDKRRSGILESGYHEGEIEGNYVRWPGQ